MAPPITQHDLPAEWDVLENRFRHTRRSLVHVHALELAPAEQDTTLITFLPNKSGLYVA